MLAKAFRRKATGGDTARSPNSRPLTAPPGGRCGPGPARRAPRPAHAPRSAPPSGRERRSARGLLSPRGAGEQVRSGGSPCPYPELLPGALGFAGKGMEPRPRETGRQGSGLLGVGLHGNAQSTRFLPECSCRRISPKPGAFPLVPPRERPGPVVPALLPLSFDSLSASLTIRCPQLPLGAELVPGPATSNYPLPTPTQTTLKHPPRPVRLGWLERPPSPKRGRVYSRSAHTQVSGGIPGHPRREAADGCFSHIDVSLSLPPSSF